MDKLYTAGELAKLIGVSSRTVRYYDEKGLLKPVAYSEGGYRLYDTNSAIQLQKIKVLQYAGLRLEDIIPIVSKSDEEPVSEILWHQKLLLEQERDRMNEMISAIDDALFICKNGVSNQNTTEQILDILKITNMESSFDYRFNMYEKYSKNQKDFHPWVMDNLELFSGARILDMGSGYGMIWVKNWTRIPADTEITMVDVLNSGMDFFEHFYEENKRFLQENVRFRFLRQDLEKEFTFDAEYDRVIANHLWEFIKEPNHLMQRAANALAEEGFLLSTFSSYGVMEAANDLFKELSLGIDFDSVIRKPFVFRKQMEEKLCMHFSKVDCLQFESRLEGLDDARILLRYIEGRYPQEYAEYASKWKYCTQRINRHIKEQGPLEISSMSPLYKCFKKEK